MHKTFLTILASSMLAISPASGGTALVTSSAALGGNDLIDWASLGPDNSYVSPFTSSTTVNGRDYIVSQGGVSFYRLEQGTTWMGNFAPGAPVLWNSFSGEVRIVFLSDVYGLGAQIQAKYARNFVARITAYDNLFNPLGSYTRQGNSTDLGDNSAIYIGLLSTQRNIRRVVLSLDSASAYPEAFAIGNVDVASAPEPATISLLGVALAVGGLSLARRKKA